MLGYCTSKTALRRQGNSWMPKLLSLRWCSYQSSRNFHNSLQRASKVWNGDPQLQLSGIQTRLELILEPSHYNYATRQMVLPSLKSKCWYGHWRLGCNDLEGRWLRCAGSWAQSTRWPLSAVVLGWTHWLTQKCRIAHQSRWHVRWQQRTKPQTGSCQPLRQLQRPKWLRLQLAWSNAHSRRLRMDSGPWYQDCGLGSHRFPKRRRWKSRQRLLPKVENRIQPKLKPCHQPWWSWKHSASRLNLF